MATAKLSASCNARRLPTAFRRAWLVSYLAIWTATLSAALLTVALGAHFKAQVRAAIGAHLDLAQNAPPHLGHVLALAAHNFPIASWPLLLGVLGAHHNRASRACADVVVAASLLANTTPTGAALGAYGASLLSYLPQLPLEWAGLALGACAWLIQRRRPMLVGEGVLIGALVLAALLGAALLETIAVPHR